MPEKAIFISHSSKDYEIAKRFCDVFEENGLGCWIAPRDIPYGAEWAETIVRGIRASSIMLVLITEHSVASKHVIREIHSAVRNDVRVLYVRLDSAPLSDGLAYYLDVLQEIDIDPSSGLCDETLLELAAYIKTHFLGLPKCEADGGQKSSSHGRKKAVSETSAGSSILQDRPGAANEDAFSDMMRGLLKKMR